MLFPTDPFPTILLPTILLGKKSLSRGITIDNEITIENHCFPTVNQATLCRIDSWLNAWNAWKDLSTAGLTRIPMNPKHVHQAIPVGIRRKQGCEDHRGRCDQRPSRPRDLQPIRGGEWSHERPLARAIDTKGGDWQPAFN